MKQIRFHPTSSRSVIGITTAFKMTHMLPSAKSKRILWSLDPFEEESALHKNMIQILRLFLKLNQINITPIYVLESQFDPLLQIESLTMKRKLKTTHQTIQSLLHRNKLSDLLQAPEIICKHFNSPIQIADAVIHYALLNHTDLILVNTHGRKGIQRFVFGSCAETLVVRSPIPVLVVGARPLKTEHLTHILFPTDFSQGSKEIFRQIVATAKQFQASITLFHAALNPNDLGFQSAIYLMSEISIPVSLFINVDFARKKRRIKAWAAWANHQGVPTTEEIELRSKNIALSILKKAEQRKAHLITMQTQSGPISASVIGSVTREVIRSGLFPVWTIHFRNKRNGRHPIRQIASFLSA